MRKIIIIILAVVIIGGGAAYYFLAVRGHQDKAEKPVELTAFVPGDYFVTNVADSSSLFKVTVVLMLNTDKLEEKLSENEYVIRDTIIAHLRTLTESDLTSGDIQDRLRSDLKDEINKVLGIDNIVTIYFRRFCHAITAASLCAKVFILREEVKQLSEILSQSEIDNLIKELAMGDQTAADEGSGDAEVIVKPYDFKTANRFPKEQMRTINIVMQSYAQLLANYFTGALRTPSEIEILSIEELMFYEFNNALPSPVVLAVVNTEPLDGSILFQISAEISDAIISRLLGGTSTNMITKKAFTEIELAIIERVIKQIIRTFDESWIKVIKTRSFLERIETSSQFAQIVDINEPVAVITLERKNWPRYRRYQHLSAAYGA